MSIYGLNTSNIFFFFTGLLRALTHQYAFLISLKGNKQNFPNRSDRGTIFLRSSPSDQCFMEHPQKEVSLYWRLFFSKNSNNCKLGGPYSFYKGHKFLTFRWVGVIPLFLLWNPKGRQSFVTVSLAQPCRQCQ